MSKYKVGDKVRTIKLRDCGGTKLFPIGTIAVIEDIKNKTKGGFNYVLSVKNKFYYYSEDMIEPYIEKTYSDGLADAWELAKQIVLDDGMECDTFMKIFGTYSGYEEVLRTMTPQQVLAKIEAYEESKTIKVGDVVYADDEPDSFGVVTWKHGNGVYVMWDDGSCGDENIEELCKTGRHLDIENLLEQIRGNE